MFFDGFTWQVGATFCAAIAAGIVGLRQVGIADGQRAIAREQAATAKAAMEVAKAQALTARLAQRSALFERRLTVFQTIQDYVRVGQKGDAFALVDFNSRLDKTITETRFLFPTNVGSAINDLISVVDEYTEMVHVRQFDSSKEIEDRTRLLRNQLRGSVTSLADIMGDEMKLYSSSQFDNPSTPKHS
jgi:hypothetical protein